MSTASHARSASTLALLATLMALALFTWCVPVRRSLIPVELDHVVRARQLRHEKHPGRDDVRVLVLEGADGTRELRVEQAVYDAVSLGDRLRKTAGARELDASGDTVPLADSTEAAQLARALLVLVAAPLAAIVAPLLRRRRAQPR